MENKSLQPTVTVSVGTYNSSKYVLETLESIKAQTYPNLILQICDDCSTDNTIEICEKWVNENKNRFVKTKIIVSEHNTGISGNANRAWDACETEWFKGIAGDDLLLQNCIEDFMKFVNDHPNAIITFSKVECFGEDKKSVEAARNHLCQSYSLFQLPVEVKLDRILLQINAVPAPSAFVNITELRKMRIRHDERIPLIEDRPKWVNFLRTGNDFFFLDKSLVKYRIGSGISTGKRNTNYLKNSRAYEIYYKIPYNIEKGNLDCLDNLVKYETRLLTENYDLKNTKAIRLQNAIIMIISRIKNLMRKIVH